MPPECDPEAREVKEGVVNGEKMVATNQQSAELSESCIGSFRNPSELVAVKLAANFIASSLVVVPVRRNQFNTLLLELLAQRAGVVAAIG